MEGVADELPARHGEAPRVGMDQRAVLFRLRALIHHGRGHLRHDSVGMVGRFP